MEYKLEIIGEFIWEVFHLFMLIGLILVVYPLLKVYVTHAQNLKEKNVQTEAKHSIIDMSQGGRYDKRIDQQRSPGRKRGF